MVLVLLGSVLQVSVGSLFRAALYPSFLLVGADILYILILGVVRPKRFPQRRQRPPGTGNRAGGSKAWSDPSCSSWRYWAAS